jgi:hypothetical protein
LRGNANGTPKNRCSQQTEKQYIRATRTTQISDAGQEPRGERKGASHAAGQGWQPQSIVCRKD